MDAQRNEDDRFDGLEAHFELPLNGGDAGTAKGSLRASPEAILAVGFTAAVILSKGDALERLLDAVPGLIGRLGGRLAVAG